MLPAELGPFKTFPPCKQMGSFTALLGRSWGGSRVPCLEAACVWKRASACLLGAGQVLTARLFCCPHCLKDTEVCVSPLGPGKTPTPWRRRQRTDWPPWLVLCFFQAGATSMWASCCGLLNEVMGTGAVRGQQPGFGGGANPFRFAPSTDFTVYTSSAAAAAAAGGTNLVCKSCGLSFSVFRKKHVCCECKKDFCSMCSVFQENLRRCSTCQLLQETAFQRPQLMRLKVKDLRQYLVLRNIPTDTCREKEDLVDLILCHHGLASEEDTDTSSLYSMQSQTSSFSTHPISLSGSVSSSQGELANRHESVGNEMQLQGQSERLLADLGEGEENAEEQTPGQSRKRARASLSDISTLDDIEGLSVRQLKEILARNFVNYSGCCEKWELVEKVGRLYRENEANHRTQGEKPPLIDEDDSLCRVCMDAVIDCVLLECGHLVTCTKCGKRMSECPICRQYVVRAVHVFKS